MSDNVSSPKNCRYTTLGKCNTPNCGYFGELKSLHIHEGGIGIPFLFCPTCYALNKIEEDNKPPFNLKSHLEGEK